MILDTQKYARMKPLNTFKYKFVLFLLLAFCCFKIIDGNDKKVLNKHGDKGCFSMASYLAAQKANKPFTVCKRPFKCGNPNGSQAFENADDVKKGVVDKFVSFPNDTISTNGICVCDFLPYWHKGRCEKAPAGSERVVSHRYSSILVLIGVIINGIGLLIMF